MPVGSAASQMMRGDTTKVKQAAPVDTVRLKKDIKDNMDNSGAINNVKELLRYSAKPEDMETFGRLNQAQKNNEKSARAEGDTLDMARKGKIPVKKP